MFVVLECHAGRAAAPPNLAVDANACGRMCSCRFFCLISSTAGAGFDFGT